MTQKVYVVTVEQIDGFEEAPTHEETFLNLLDDVCLLAYSADKFDHDNGIKIVCSAIIEQLSKNLNQVNPNFWKLLMLGKLPC